MTLMKGAFKFYKDAEDNFRLTECGEKPHPWDLRIVDVKTVYTVDMKKMKIRRKNKKSEK